MGEAFIEQAVSDNNLVEHQVKSFNDFVENRVQRILNEVGEVEPELPGGEELVIKLGDVEIERPMVKEADGSMTQLTPAEARRRDITYASRIRVTMTPIFEGRQQDPEVVTIGKIPVMVGSDICPTSDMDREELIENDEDPDDTGGYFIINGTEKVLVSMEEMANNKAIYQHDDDEQVCRINSESDGYVQRHQLKRKKGVVNINFANVKKVPAVVIMRALGLETDKDIVEAIGDEYEGEIYLNIYDTDVDTPEEAVDYIGRQSGINQDRQERVHEILDEYLLPHLGQESDARRAKAEYLGKLVKNTIALGKGDIQEDDMDHYANKRLLLAGDLLEMQFRSVFLGKWGFVARMKYN
ncbi:MAG: DNA-directed RNA polymerase subunit B'', partial [Candidatus Nanohaloarchaea archaeon]